MKINIFSFGKRVRRAENIPAIVLFFDQFRVRIAVFFCFNAKLFRRPS